MSRTSRVLRGVGIGYVTQAVVLAVGLWLTPFLLRQLGQHRYGLWLIALQITMYLSLLDFGVVALLPRETAYAVGRASTMGGAGDLHCLADTIGPAVRLVLWQIPVVALVGSAVLVSMPERWHDMQGPLAIILATFVVMFPVRVLSAVLQGLQELAFLGIVALGTWILGSATTVVLVFSGFGLYAVALGWALAQMVSAACWWYRIRNRHRAALPSRIPTVKWSDARSWLSSSVWVSVAQVAQVLLVGTDFVIIGKVLGPAVVVPYSITAKLVGVLATQPQAVMQAAMPALSEIKAGNRGSGPLLRVTMTLTQLMLMLSGGICVVVLLVNGAFVGWWIDPRQYSGLTLTAALLAIMLLRHWNTTIVYTNFCLGFERRIAITTLVDGIATVGAGVLLVRFVGPIGVVLGSALGVCFISLPANLAALTRGTDEQLGALLRPLAPWFVRFAFLTAAAGAIAHVGVPAAPSMIVCAVIVGTSAYAGAMFPVAMRSSLGAYLRPRLVAMHVWLSRPPAGTSHA